MVGDAQRHDKTHTEEVGEIVHPVHRKAGGEKVQASAVIKIGFEVLVYIADNASAQGNSLGMLRLLGPGKKARYQQH